MEKQRYQYRMKYQNNEQFRQKKLEQANKYYAEHKEEILKKKPKKPKKQKSTIIEYFKTLRFD